MLRNLFWLGLFIGAQCLAEPTDKASADCPRPLKTIDVLKCALRKNPSVERARLLNKSLETLPAKLGGVPNPEFDFESIQGKDKSEMELSLVQQIELGGRRSSRIRVAEAQQRDSSIDLHSEEAILAEETLTRLHRLRQIEIEQNVLSEISLALGQSIIQLKNRPALSAEQQVSLSLFQMTLSDAKIKQSEVFDELQSLEQYFYVSTGYSLLELRAVLPEVPESFPLVSEKNDVENSPRILKSLALNDIAYSELAEAKADSWPILRVGPIAKLEKNGGASEKSYGFKLAIDLPLFQTNGAARAHAAQNLHRTEQLIQLARTEQEQERIGLLKVYRNAVQSLKEVPTLLEILKNHQKNESLEKRGLISSSLLIESHRQRMELIRGRHGRELKAIESLLQINRIDGRKVEELL